MFDHRWRGCDETTSRGSPPRWTLLSPRRGRLRSGGRRECRKTLTTP